jgi:hypothetical protein
LLEAFVSALCRCVQELRYPPQHLLQVSSLRDAYFLTTFRRVSFY